MGEPWKRALGPLAVATVVGVFALHRVLVILSAGDFLFPIEPWEGKNAQIAWDLLTGRFGEEHYGLAAYVANAGAAHHASYSSTALVYLFVSKVLGFGMVGVRVTPLLFWIASLALWTECLRRVLGTTSAVLAGVGLFLVPTAVIAWQLTFIGCHSEAVLPLAAVVTAWMAWLARKGHSVALSILLGACAGYAFAFSYLLWPILGLMALLTLLPPRPTVSAASGGAFAGGALLGAWPLLLIVAVDPGALFTLPVTEDPGTRLTDIGAGQGGSLGLFWTTFTAPFAGFVNDYWIATDNPGALWGRWRFEGLAWRLAVFAPLPLLPLGWLLRRDAAGRLVMLVALAPLLGLVYVAYGSPFKPDLPVRYLLPLGFLGWSAPAVAVGCGLRLLKDRSSSTPRRVAAWVAVVAGGLVLLWLAPPRLIETANAVRGDRGGDLGEHRYVAYYNLGIGTTWAAQIEEVNDLLDVRAAAGSPDAFAGMQGGLLHDLQPTGIGRDTWAPLPLDADSITMGLQEWTERQSYRDDPLREYTPVAAENIGWGTGIRSRWQPHAAAVALAGARAQGEWPDELAVESFWEGYGLGWGRASDDAPATPEMMPRSIPEAFHDAVARGVSRGRTLETRHWWGDEPPFETIRQPAQ
jgi:hypothetical protein